jgi:glycosyltransferase involved in cell wall biosynthesis
LGKGALIVAGIPACDVERTIAKVVIHTARHVDKVLVVDDGSRDDTALIAERVGAVVIRHERNLGKGAALRSCISRARRLRADILVTIDADGQHDAEEIPRLVAPILRGKADLVLGSRKDAKGVPAHRRFGGRLLDRATRVTANGAIVDAQSGFRAYSRKALDKLTAAESGMGADSEILMRASEAGLRITEVPISVSYGRGLRTSKHNLVYHWFDVFFSVVKFISIRHPFLFYGGFSAAMFLVAVFFGIQTLDYYARWGHVVTNLALVSVAAAILGFTSFVTGVMLFTIITVLRERE